MTNNSKPIIVRTTPEMDNWLHPQTAERKQRIKDRVEAAKQRYAQKKLATPPKWPLHGTENKINAASDILLEKVQFRSGKALRVVGKRRGRH